MRRNVVMAGMMHPNSLMLANGLIRDGWRLTLLCPEAEAAAWQAAVPYFTQPRTLLPVNFQNEKTIAEAADTVACEIHSADMLITHLNYLSADTTRTITDGLDYTEIQKTYDINTLGVLRVVSAFYALLEKGALKRICTVSATDGSNYASRQTDNYARAMSLSALHMQLNILFNRLRPDGYTFRVYGTDDNEDAYGEYALDYFTRARSFERNDLKHSDEERLVLRNGLGRELPW